MVPTFLPDTVTKQQHRWFFFFIFPRHRYVQIIRSSNRYNVWFYLAECQFIIVNINFYLLHFNAYIANRSNGYRKYPMSYILSLLMYFLQYNTHKANMVAGYIKVKRLTQQFSDIFLTMPTLNMKKQASARRTNEPHRGSQRKERRELCTEKISTTAFMIKYFMFWRFWFTERHPSRRRSARNSQNRNFKSPTSVRPSMAPLGSLGSTYGVVESVALSWPKEAGVCWKRRAVVECCIYSRWR